MAAPVSIEQRKKNLQDQITEYKKKIVLMSQTPVLTDVRCTWDLKTGSAGQVGGRYYRRCKNSAVANYAPALCHTHWKSVLNAEIKSREFELASLVDPNIAGVSSGKYVAYARASDLYVSAADIVKIQNANLTCNASVDDRLQFARTYFGVPDMTKIACEIIQSVPVTQKGVEALENAKAAAAASVGAAIGGGEESP